MDLKRNAEEHITSEHKSPNMMLKEEPQPLPVHHPLQSFSSFTQYPLSPEDHVLPTSQTLGSYSDQYKHNQQGLSGSVDTANRRDSANGDLPTPNEDLAGDVMLADNPLKNAALGTQPILSENVEASTVRFGVDPSAQALPTADSESLSMQLDPKAEIEDVEPAKKKRRASDGMYVISS